MYLFHSRGLNLLLLIISVSILDIKMFAKSKVHAAFVVFSDTVYKYDVKCHSE